MTDEKKIFTEWDNRFQCKLYSSKSADQKLQNVMKRNSFPSEDKDFKRELIQFEMRGFHVRTKNSFLWP